MAAFSDMWVNASGSCETTITWTAGDSIEFISPPIDYSILSYYDEIEIQRRYNDMINELHREENRKDLFREASLFQPVISHHQNIQHNFIPATRNVRGNQSSRV